MHHAISKFTLVALLLSAVACQTVEQKEKRAERVIREASWNQRVYKYNYDSVWRATQLAVKYPIAVNNMDHGILETDWIKGADGFVPPGSESLPSAGQRYKLILNIVKGKLEDKESVRVTINKKIEKQRDFFSDPEQLDTDGLEEKTLFYRIERELIIEEALKKSNRT